MKTYSGNSNNRNKIFIAASVFGVIIFVFLIAPFISPSLGGVFRTALKPIVIFSDSVGNGVLNLRSYFLSKKILTKENLEFKDRIKELEVILLDRETLVNENTYLKETLGRASSKKLILGKVLIKPNRSLYDTLILDIGSDANVSVGAKVFAYGNIPMGIISNVDSGTSVVKLYSTSGEKIFGRVEGTHIDIQLTGRGGGNFEAELPREVTVLEGTNVLLPDINAHIIARVGKELSDPRDPVQKFLLTSPVNMSELDFVEVEG